MSVSSISTSTSESLNTQELIKKWVELDESLRSLKEEEKEIKARQKELEPMIMEFMRESENTNLNLSKSGISLELVTKVQKQPISMRNLSSFLTSFFAGDVVKANGIVTFIDGQRTTRSSEHLVRKFLTDKKQKKPAVLSEEPVFTMSDT